MRRKPHREGCGLSFSPRESTERETGANRRSPGDFKKKTLSIFQQISAEYSRGLEKSAALDRGPRIKKGEVKHLMMSQSTSGLSLLAWMHFFPNYRITMTGQTVPNIGKTTVRKRTFEECRQSHTN
jgi:hypothetical protein